jgi:hypothetical protein
VVSAPKDVPARAMALRSTAAVKAAALACRSSTKLSRIAFIGLLALPLLEPNGFHLVRDGRVMSAQDVQTGIARPLPAPLTPTVPPSADAQSSEPPPGKASDAEVPRLPESGVMPPALTEQAAGPAGPAGSAKPVPPAAQKAPPWTDEEIAAARHDCDRLLEKVTLVSEALPPAREGACGAPAPREVKSIGDSKVKFEPPATLNCPMIAGLASWISDKLQPAAQQNFGSPVVRIVAESYSCRNRYGLANAPISEHAFMDAIDVSAFVMANGTIVRVAKSWGATANKESKTTGDKGKLLAAASKLGAHDVAQQTDRKTEPASPQKGVVTKEALSAFLHQAHNGACGIFGTVLGPDTNDAHRDHFHLDMKARKQPALCE